MNYSDSPFGRPYYPESLRRFLADDQLGMATACYLDGRIEVEEFERRVGLALLASSGGKGDG